MHAYTIQVKTRKYELLKQIKKQFILIVFLLGICSFNQIGESIPRSSEYALDETDLVPAE